MKGDSQKDSSKANSWLYGKGKSPRVPYSERTSKCLSEFINEQDDNYSYYPVCSVHNVRCVYADIEFSCGRNCLMKKIRKTNKNIMEEE